MSKPNLPLPSFAIETMDLPRLTKSPLPHALPANGTRSAGLNKTQQLLKFGLMPDPLALLMLLQPPRHKGRVSWTCSAAALSRA